MTSLLRRALALVLALNLFAVGAIAPADARMMFDPNGTGKLVMPGLRHIPTIPGTVQLPKWKDALAGYAAGTKSPRLLGIGPAHMAGYTSTMAGARQASPLVKVADAYAAQGYKVNTCSFFGNQSTSATNPYTASSSTSFDARITMSGVTLGGASSKTLGQFPFVFTKAGDTISLACADAIDSLVVYVSQGVPGSGIVSVNVDGGSTLGTVSANGPINGVTPVTITFPKAVHVANLVWTSGYVGIVGAMGYDSTARELQVLNVGISDSVVADLAYASGAPAMLNALAVLAPDLTIVQQTPADTSGLTSMQAYRGGFGRLFSWLKDIGSDVAAETMSPYDTTLTNMGASNQQAYVDAFKATATNLAIPTFDLYAYLGSYTAQNSAGRQASTRLRNAAGYAYDAAFLKAGIDAALLAPALSYPAPQTYDVADAAGLNALFPSPGSTVRIYRGGTSAPIVGPVSLGFTGTADAPITITTYGPTTAPAVITGTPSPDMANPNFVDAVTILSSYVTVDGGTIDNGKLGLWAKDTGRAAFMKVEGTLGFSVFRTEMSGTGSGVIHYGRKGKYVGNYIHDMVMVRNDYSSTLPKNDNDYGANPFILSGSDVEIAWNRVARDIAQSYDYGTDGGGLEFYPIYGFISNINAHDNLFEGGDGFIEGGGSTGQGTGIDLVTIQGNISLNNFGFSALHNQGGLFAMGIKRFLASKNTIVEENNTISTRHTIILDGISSPNIDGFQIPNYGFNDNIIVLNNGKSVFSQFDATYHQGNVFYLANKDPANTGGGNDGTKTHLYNNYQMTPGTGEAYLTASPFVDQAGRNFAVTAGSGAVGKGRAGWTPIPVAGISAWPADYNPSPAKAATTTTLATSNATPASGTSITLTATVAPSAATGTVTFYDGNTVLGTGALSSGTATLPISTLGVGTHTIKAVYGGDAANVASISNAVTVTVN